MTFMECLEYYCLPVCLFTFLLNVNYASSKNDTSCSLKNPLANDSGNHLQYWFLGSQPGDKSSCTVLTLCGNSVWSFIALWGEAFDIKFKEPAGIGVFGGLLPIRHQCYPNSPQLKYFLFFFSMGSLQNVFTLCCKVNLHVIFDSFFLFVQNFPWCILCRSIAKGTHTSHKCMKVTPVACLTLQQW
jgi:hypothetical protein